MRSTDAAGYPEEQLVWDAMRWTPVSAIPPNIETQEGVTTVIEPQVSGPEEFVVKFVGVGYHGHLLRVYARGAGEAPVNSATWTAPLAAGEYSVEAFIPNEHAEAEVGYTVHASTGETTVEVHQKSYNDLWVKLGDFSFGDEGATVTTNDAAGVKKEEIAWDAIRFTAIPQPSPGKAKEPTSGNESHGGTTTQPINQLPNLALVEPMVPEQNGLVDFAKLGLRLGRHGPKLASHGYSDPQALPRAEELEAQLPLPAVRGGLIAAEATLGVQDAAHPHHPDPRRPTRARGEAAALQGHPASGRSI